MPHVALCTLPFTTWRGLGQCWAHLAWAGGLRYTERVMAKPLLWQLAGMALVVAACSKHIDDRGSSDVDFKSAKRVVSSIFYAAQSGESQHLASLCDPEGQANEHVLRVCAQDKEGDDWQAFVKQFAKGKLIGEARITEDRALVNFVFGEKGETSETMELVRRDDRWYLLAF